jgi:dihydroorotase-like cyclic amidohydrolase
VPRTNTAEAPGNTRRCFEALRTNPLSKNDPDRQHRLRGRLGEGTLGGIDHPQWEYEVTAGGRVRYLIDEARHTVHLVHASTRHPKDTDS